MCCKCSYTFIIIVYCIVYMFSLYLSQPAATKLKAVSKPQHSNAAAGSPVSSRLPTISSSTTSDRKMASTKAAPPAAPSPKRPTSTAPSGTTFSAMTYSRDLRPKVRLCCYYARLNEYWNAESHSSFVL